jgi:hypothetical protein
MGASRQTSRARGGERPEMRTPAVAGGVTRMLDEHRVPDQRGVGDEGERGGGIGHAGLGRRWAGGANLGRAAGEAQGDHRAAARSEQ